MIKNNLENQDFHKRPSFSINSEKIMNDSETDSQKDDDFDSQKRQNSIVIKRPKSRWMWKARGQKRLRWDLFIMLLATWNLFYVPYSVAFESNIGNEIITDIMNWFIDVFFILDILINFRTTIINEKTGEDIKDQKKIAIKYLKNKFWIDLLASLPFDSITLIFIENDHSNSLTLQMFGLLKLVRILRLSRLISYMNLKDDLKMSLKLGKLIFFLVMYLHWVGCIWFYIAKQDEKWIPPLDYVYITTEIYNESALHKYWSSLYHAVLMLGGNDIGPRGTLQLIFLAILLFAGAIINANIFGNIAVLLQQLNRKATTFQEKIENAHSAMKSLAVPEDIQEQVQKYLDYTQSTSDHQQELNRFLVMLSPSLKEIVINHISHQAVSKNEVFGGSKEILNLVLPELNILLFTPEDILVRQEENPESMFFICKGEWDVFIGDSSSKERFVNELKQGTYFGEVAILKNCKRTATVKSKNYSTLTSLHKDHLISLLKRYPDIETKMNAYIYSKYKDKRKKFVKKALLNIDYLSSKISDEIIEEISYKLETVNLNANTYLFQNGKACKEIYIILRGEVDVLIKNSKKESYLDTLYIGWSTGSYSILTGEDYWFSVKSKTEWKVLMLSHESLEQLREKYDELNFNISEYEGYIEKEGIPYCDYKFFRATQFNVNPYKKFQMGVKRIMRIVVCYLMAKSLEIVQSR
jgi:CRP-like cAMP-binding protein